LTRFIFDIGDTAQWVLGVGLLVWIIQYTVYGIKAGYGWWRTVIGRSLIGIAVAFELVLGPSLYVLSNPTSGFIRSTGYGYLETGNLVFAAVVVLLIIWGFWRERRRAVKAGMKGTTP